MILNFFEHEDFVGERGRTTDEPALSFQADIHSPGSHCYVEHMHRESQGPHYVRHGVLHGEYLSLNGWILLRRDFQFISYHMQIPTPAVREYLERKTESEDFQSYCASMIKMWDQFPLVERVPLIADMNFHNYYHFTVDILPRFRFIDFRRTSEVYVPLSTGLKAFHEDLFQKVMNAHGNGKQILFPMSSFRVNDPFLIHSGASREGIDWIRKTVNIKTQPGAKRYYIDRQGSSDKENTDRYLAQTDDLRSILGEFKFSSVEFSGDTPVSDQISKLEGAGIILSVHGANLTNIIYLEPPLVLIEILGAKYLDKILDQGSHYLHLSKLRGFKYHAIISDRYDSDGRILVDGELLRSILRKYL